MKNELSSRHPYEELYNSNLESIKRSFKLNFLHCNSCGDLYPHFKKYYQEVRVPLKKISLLWPFQRHEKVSKFYHLKFDWGHNMRVFSVILPLPIIFLNDYVRIYDLSLKNQLLEKIKESLEKGTDKDYGK